MAWVSPTGHVASAWTFETRAYDDDLETVASGTSETVYLTLTHSAINCDKIRVYAADRSNSTYYDPTLSIDVYYSAGWHNIFVGSITKQTWVEKAIGSTESVTAVRMKLTNGARQYHYVYEVDFWEAATAPTVTIQAVSSIEDTTATGNGNITDTGNGICDLRGFVWDLASQGAPGNVAPGASGYANDVPEANGFGTGAFTGSLTGLPTGDTIYVRAYVHNSWGYAYSDEVSFLTKPAAPTNVDATDGDHTDKVVITWTKSTGATGYKVYEGENLLDTLGDVATYDDEAAPAPTITAGTGAATDGLTAYVTLSLSGESVNNGASRTYKVIALNATGDSDASGTNAGYRGVGSLTYQWQISAADSDADYGNISGATTEPYNHTVAHTDGRYYKCVENATGATEQISSADRGWRKHLPVTDGDLIGIGIIRKS